MQGRFSNYNEIKLEIKNSKIQRKLVNPTQFQINHEIKNKSCDVEVRKYVELNKKTYPNLTDVAQRKFYRYERLYYKGKTKCISLQELIGENLL